MQSLNGFGKQITLVGPWGGLNGHHWDDGVHSTIRQLEIVHGDGIDSIRIEYDNNGRSVWGEKHGGSGGSKTDKIRLEYPNEYLTSVHGHYGSLKERGPVLVRSLTFESNKRKYGPYGVEQGTYFMVPKTHGKIVGFLGKSGWYLDAIGAYLETIPKPMAPNSIISSQQYVVNGGAEKYEYSMIQGSLGTNYDLIVAFRQKDDNHHKYPPIDLSKKTAFDLNHAGHKNEVDSVVVPAKIERVPPKTAKGVVTYGPWGGSGGSPFDDGVYDGIKQINLSRNVGIVTIRVCYEQNGQIVWGSKNGGTGGYKHDKIVFDYPSEILTHISGYHGPTMIMGPNVIKSLTFHTTKGRHGPYGEEQGEFFSTRLKEGSMIVGLHGKKGLFVDAIGVHALEGRVFPSTTDINKHASSSPVKSSNQAALVVHSSVSNTKTPASSSLVKSNNQTALATVDNSQWHFKIGKPGQTPQEGVHKMVKDPAPYGPGPWGGDGGKAWDDGVFTGIKQIVLTQTDAICCIEFEYDRNGQSVWSVKHGGDGGGGQAVNRVKLDYPNEVLTSITGYYGPIKKEQGTKVIQSLTFHTSRKKYGPFGDELGTYFGSGTTEGKVVGFHGRSSMYLDAIGVHMQHWLGNQRSKPSWRHR
ncbi:hypothetical protein BUALT_Bualt01G0028800 [Buddleja alternifolia]|uniref:Jacalin-type lectin domain-containing protein n=1 Tax=Buddleja alternifolia TaxID=168488 RepID=A0AAV6YBW7_9LAMI|nr:hypothetical protein BUALT_Bualt01G0028800 [Buddleja alternifolia]